MDWIVFLSYVADAVVVLAIGGMIWFAIRAGKSKHKESNDTSALD